MSAKSLDAYQRWRCVSVGFRMSPEESDQLNRLVAISGLSKQDYIINRLLEREMVVVGNPRVYKALRIEMERIALELERLNTLEETTPELQTMITTVSEVYNRMSEQK